MDRKKLYDRINKFFSDKKVEYDGKLFSFDENSHSEFKFKIIGTKRLIRVGEEYDYAVVQVFDMKSTSEVFKLLSDNKVLNSQYYLQRTLETKLEKILSVFDIYDVVVTKIEAAENVKL